MLQVLEQLGGPTPAGAGRNAAACCAPPPGHGFRWTWAALWEYPGSLRSTCSLDPGDQLHVPLQRSERLRRRRGEHRRARSPTSTSRGTRSATTCAAAGGLTEDGAHRIHGDRRRPCCAAAARCITQPAAGVDDSSPNRNAWSRDREAGAQRTGPGRCRLHRRDAGTWCSRSSTTSRRSSGDNGDRGDDLPGLGRHRASGRPPVAGRLPARQSLFRACLRPAASGSALGRRASRRYRRRAAGGRPRRWSPPAAPPRRTTWCCTRRSHYLRRRRRARRSGAASCTPRSSTRRWPNLRNSLPGWASPCARWRRSAPTACSTWTGLAACLDDATRLVAVDRREQRNRRHPAARGGRHWRSCADHAQRGIGRRIHFHTDAVQALCRGLEVPISAADSAAASAHKLGGPVGVGALWLSGAAAAGVAARAAAASREAAVAGTENVAGMRCIRPPGDGARFAPAAARHPCGTPPTCATRNCSPAATRLRLASGAARSARERPECYSPYIVCLSAPGVPAEVLVRVLSDRGRLPVAWIAACSSSGQKTSPVLQRDGRAQAGRGRRVSGFDRVEHHRSRHRPPARRPRTGADRRCGRST